MKITRESLTKVLLQVAAVCCQVPLGRAVRIKVFTTLTNSLDYVTTSLEHGKHRSSRRDRQQEVILHKQLQAKRMKRKNVSSQAPDGDSLEAEPAKTQRDCTANATDLAEPAAVETLDPVKPKLAEGNAATPLRPSEKSTGGRGAPVVPWMRAPIEIGASGNTALTLVRGCDPQLLATLQKRKRIEGYYCGY